MGLHNIPEHSVVGVTTRVIAQSSANTFRYLVDVSQQVIDGHRSKLILTLQRVIRIGNIRLMVLVMV
jgi:hypothetical protein